MFSICFDGLFNHFSFSGTGYKSSDKHKIKYTSGVLRSWNMILKRRPFAFNCFRSEVGRIFPDPPLQTPFWFPIGTG